MVISASTIEEVAARAGVSRSTVSRVVNGSPAVSEVARESVRRAIDDLNYVPNRAARALASRHSQAIALVVPEDTARFFGDPFFAAVVSGIQARLASTDYILNVILATGDPGDKTTGYLRSGSVDGAIIVSHHDNDTFIDRIAGAIPVVYGGRRVRVRDEDHVVDSDNVGGGRAATEHLLERGRRRIATITGPPSMRSSLDRLDGFRAVLDDAGLAPVAVEDGDFSEDGGAAAMRRILASGQEVDAVFAASDLMARGALRVLRDAGLAVPDDVAVVGFDDSMIAATTSPPLTTIRQPSRGQGERLVEILLDLLRGASPEHATVMPIELVVREST
ncbi:LacI family DNA-binding transcriptional regulator [Microbacterium hatanonis]|jgi:DNA-binding LacI/PurR family transcriptional regulator|uniref:LacI family transcriptional regulator n=1 Tax=Microbacterium hatanonis TaxID=404366 RepID=A0A5C8HWU7_9MICO|nr:LacI family DNA-binding transcriptional regulator [Microbacterium hatanonis]TXK09444.1 LacI family transcriptional regulator [Microbacterium hatanonis]